MFVYITGIGGLGNCLFQIMTGIYYCRKYGYELRFINGGVLENGTNHSKKINQYKNTEFRSYKTTLYNNVIWINRTEMTNYTIVKNTLSNNKIIPTKIY